MFLKKKEKKEIVSLFHSYGILWPVGTLQGGRLRLFHLDTTCSYPQHPDTCAWFGRRNTEAWRFPGLYSRTGHSPSLSTSWGWLQARGTCSGICWHLHSLFLLLLLSFSSSSWHHPPRDKKTAWSWSPSPLLFLKNLSIYGCVGSLFLCEGFL